MSFVWLGSVVVRALDLRLSGHRTIGWLILGWWPSSGGHTISVCNQPPRSTQPLTLCGIGNEHRPKCSDVLQLGVKAGCG